MKSKNTAAQTLPQEHKAEKIITCHMWSSFGVGMIPLPLLDFVALTGIQLHMLKKIARIYDIPFSRDKVKNILSALIGGALPGMISSPLISAIKIIPLAGQAIGVITMPVVAGATTYAVGKVFTQHFASGGTFLTFNPEEVRAYYAEMLKQGEKIAKEGEKASAEADNKKSAVKNEEN